MCKLKFLFLIPLFLTSHIYAQNGERLNKTLQYLDTISFADDNSHSSIFGFGSSLSENENELSVKPVINANIVISQNENNTFRTGEGLVANYQPNNKLSCNIYLSHNFSQYPLEIKNDVDSLFVLPGEGINYREFNNVYSWINLRGNLRYNPYSYLTLEIGNDKHFLGNGYRSLFMSDVSSSYPYFSTSLNIWKIHYLSITAMLKDIYKPSDFETEYRTKYATFHYLSWNITKAINLNFFEAIVWRGNDSSLYNGMNVNYLNPVIFMRPVEYAQGSTDNSLLGAGLNFIIKKNVILYSQLILDEFFAKEIRNKGYRDNKHGYQLGVKGKHTMNGVLFWRFETNTVRPFTFSHYSTLQSYGNMMQPVGHPQGANFRDFHVGLSYAFKKWYCNGVYTLTHFGKNDGENLHGNDIYTNYWDVDDRNGHFLFNGIDVKQHYGNFKIGYFIKSDWNMSVEGGVAIQRQKTNVNPVDFTIFYFGVRTLLYNQQWFEQ